MSEKTTPLPEFDAPPVSEVALSIEFLPLTNWRSPHSGLFWSIIKDEYPNTEVAPPLESQIEKFGEEFWRHGPTVRLQIANPDVSRFWFISSDKTRLIQVQRDRFIVNWRKIQGDEIYPHYEADMRPRLGREWLRFKQFVADAGIGEISVQQCEVTYVNDIVEGDAWRTFADTLRLFSLWWGKGSTGFLPAPEQLTVAGSFEMPNQSGRLHFVSQPVFRRLDERRASQFRLTARGKPPSGTDNDLMAWMDVAHEWVVRGFADLTSDAAHKLWKRRV